MQQFQKVALFLLLLLASTASQSAEFCTYDSYYSNSPTCFTSFAEAEAYLYAAKGSSQSHVDADPSLAELEDTTLKEWNGSTYKYSYYRYKTIAPVNDLGRRYYVCGTNMWLCGPGDESAGFLSEEDAIQYIRDMDGNQNKQFYLMYENPGEDKVAGNNYSTTTAKGTLRYHLEVHKGGKRYCDSQEGQTPTSYCFDVWSKHYYECPDTHGPNGGAPLSQACVWNRTPATIQISAKDEPIQSSETCSVGNPCHPQTGIKTQDEVDFTWDGLTFTRTYSSSNELSPSAQLGAGWTTSLDSDLLNVSMAYPYRLSRRAAKYDLYLYDWEGSTGYYSQNVPGSKIVKIDDTHFRQVTADGKEFVLEKAVGTDEYRITTIEDRRSNNTFAITYCTGNDISASCAPNQIKSIVSGRGRNLDFIYGDIFDASSKAIGNRLLTIAADGVIQVTYEYDFEGRLKSAKYPGTSTSTRTYGYNESGRVCVSGSGSTLTPCHIANRRTLLTSIRDENGVDFATFKYDNFGRVVSSEHAGGKDKVTLSYANGFSTSVTNASGLVTTYNSVANGNFYKLSGTTAASQTTANTYDANGFLDLVTDKAGIITDNDYNAFGQLTQVIRAKGRPEQQIETTLWHPTLNLPTQIDRAGQRTTLAYNDRGQVLTRTTTDLTVTPNVSRTITNTYCELVNIDAGSCPLLGALTSTDGSRTDVSDVSTFTYYSADEGSCTANPATCAYRKGDLWKVTNPAGQVSENLQYDASGRVTSVKDINGVITDLEYSPRGWIVARKVRGSDNSIEADDAITRMAYDAIGQVTQVTQADGVFVKFTYDAAHRLTDITDASSNKIHYILDNAGNRTKEETSDSAGVLKMMLSRIYNALGQLQTLKDANLAATGFTYNLNGTLDKTTDALGRVTDNDYDALGRLSQSIANVNRKALDQATTKFQYDERSNLKAVIDPKGLATGYVYDGLDNLKQISSPDTGITSFGYDSGGNRKFQTDARGLTTNYNYDALNRLTSLSLPTESLNIQFQYDDPTSDCMSNEMYGAGRLSQITDESGNTRYCYDLLGNVTRKVQSIVGGNRLTVAATYSASGRVTAMTYPSGAIVTYLRDANGQVSHISAVPSEGSAQITLVSSAKYLPFGPLTNLTFGNGRVLTKAYDQNYGVDLVSDSATTGLREDFSLNAVGNITALTERTNATTSVTRSFVYDGLDRLTTQKNGSAIVEGFKYDATGNRTSKTTGATTVAYSYPATSHRLSSVGSTSRVYDAVGNTTQIGTGAAAKGFVFDDRGRLRDFKLGTSVKTSYRYNGKGEQVFRIDSVNAANSLQFVYDEAGHLLGEYTATGERVKEYVWLDDTLVGVLSNHDGSTYQFVETDHLGTPRAVIHPAENNIVWRWDLNSTSFGDHAPNNNPDADTATYIFNMRFPGQRLDSDSGLHQNGYRDFDPFTGRYVESDPLGIWAGVSTYGYVRGNPLGYIDPFGLDAMCGPGGSASPISGQPGSFRCIPNGEDLNQRFCSPGSLDCLTHNGVDQDSPYNESNLCKIDRLGNSICYVTCRSKRKEEANKVNTQAGSLLKPLGRKVPYIGNVLDVGISLWQTLQDHNHCKQACGIDTSKDCACNGK